MKKKWKKHNFFEFKQYLKENIKYIWKSIKFKYIENGCLF